MQGRSGETGLRVTSDSELIYIGCYTPETGGSGEGIVAARRDPGSGYLEPLGLAARTPSPSFLARHPTLPVLYAVNEVDRGAVSAWAVEAPAHLRPMGTRSTGGAHPCHLAVSPTGQHLFSANYGSGSVAVHALDPVGALRERTDLLAHDGPGPQPRHDERQAAVGAMFASRPDWERQKAHAHMVSPRPDGGRLLAIDLGADAVFRYEVDQLTGALKPYGQRIRTRPGTGPRHLARHPDGRRCYLVGELNATVTEYELDPSTESLHERWRGDTSRAGGHVQPSEIAVSAGGRFLYVANRGPDTVSVFTLDGRPRYVGEVGTGGQWPRHFALVGAQLYVANERSHTVAVFHVDPHTGIPASAGEPFAVPSPTCVLPASRL